MRDAGERAQALYNQWADAFSTALENSTSGQTDVDADVQNQARTVNGKKVAWIKENILLERGEQSVHTFIEEYIKKHIGEVYTIFESGQKVYLGEDLPNEYTHSEYTNNIRNTAKGKAKNRAAADLGTMIEIATNRKWEKTKNTETKDAKYGFYKYDTKFAFPVFVGEKLTSVKAYSASLLIRNASDGKKYLYDVINIKKDDAIGVELFKKESRSLKRAHLTSSADTVSQKNESVKENISDTQNQVRRRRNKNYLDVESRFGVAESVLKYAETVSDPALKAKLKANATTYAKKLDEYETESIRYDNATANGWDEMAAIKKRNQIIKNKAAGSCGFCNLIHIFFGDMCVEKYTYDVRECRANGAPAKLVLWGKQRGARRERTDI